MQWILLNRPRKRIYEGYQGFGDRNLINLTNY